MRTLAKTAVATLMMLFLGCGSALAVGFMLADTYIGPGATHASYQNADVIGSLDDFDILGLNAAWSSDLLKVDLYSTYFDTGSMGRYGTALGDLFISVDGYAGEGESWEYAAVLDDHSPLITDGKASGQVALYNRADGGITIDSHVSHSGYIYRAGQAVQYTPMANAMAMGNWQIEDNWLSIHIAGPDILPMVTEMGFHYAMTCGNDVIEGGVAPVPEPATMVLLGTGLIGLAGMSRRQGKKTRPLRDAA